MTQYMCDILIRIASLYHTEKGCAIKIYNPKGVYIDKLKVVKVYDSGVIAGYSLIKDIDTAYDITDGLLIDILEPGQIPFKKNKRTRVC